MIVTKNQSEEVENKRNSCTFDKKLFTVVNQKNFGQINQFSAFIDILWVFIGF
jgi:hypothetical protein